MTRGRSQRMYVQSENDSKYNVQRHVATSGETFIQSFNMCNYQWFLRSINKNRPFTATLTLNTSFLVLCKGSNCFF